VPARLPVRSLALPLRLQGDATARRLRGAEVGTGARRGCSRRSHAAAVEARIKPLNCLMFLLCLGVALFGRLAEPTQRFRVTLLRTKVFGKKSDQECTARWHLLALQLCAAIVELWDRLYEHLCRCSTCPRGCSAPRLLFVRPLCTTIALPWPCWYRFLERYRGYTALWHILTCSAALRCHIAAFHAPPQWGDWI